MAEPAPAIELERTDAPAAAVLPLHPGLAVARGYARARMKGVSDDPRTRARGGVWQESA